MKRLAAVCSLLVLAAFLLPDNASACGRRCQQRAGMPPGCQECADAPGSNENCTDNGQCTCLDVMCFSVSAADPQEAQLASIFSATSVPAACSSGLPIALTAPSAQ
jgi:hypothetical protein